MTTYSCCINVSRTTYYYKTYTNNQLNAIDMRRENLNASSLRSFPLATAQKIAWAN